MACDHRLIQKQWMLGQVGYEDSCPECDKKRIAELEKESAEDFEKTEEQLDEKNRRIAELEKMLRKVLYEGRMSMGPSDYWANLPPNTLDAIETLLPKENEG